MFWIKKSFKNEINLTDASTVDDSSRQTYILCEQYCVAVVSMHWHHYPSHQQCWLQPANLLWLNVSRPTVFSYKSQCMQFLVCLTCHWNKYQLQHCKEQSLASHLQWTYWHIPLASPFIHHLYSHCVVLGHILNEVSIQDSWVHNTNVGSLLVDSQDLQI